MPKIAILGTEVLSIDTSIMCTAQCIRHSSQLNTHYSPMWHSVSVNTRPLLFYTNLFWNQIEFSCFQYNLMELTSGPEKQRFQIKSRDKGFWNKGRLSITSQVIQFGIGLIGFYGEEPLRIYLSLVIYWRNFMKLWPCRWTPAVY